MHMQKTYLSLAVTRAMATEHPIGDPFGGPAYGERNMPVAAVAVAVFQVAAAVEVGFAALTVFEAVSVVSSVVSAVGAVTGNQELSQIGMIGGLIGGVGGYAASNGWLGDVGTSLGTTTIGGESALSGTVEGQTLYQQQIESMVGIDRGAAETGAPTSVVPDVKPVAAEAGGNVTGVTADYGYTGVGEVPASRTEGVINTATTPTAPGVETPTATGAVTPTATGAVTPTATGAVAPAAPTAAADAAKVVTGKPEGLWDSFKAFAKANPTITYAGMTTAGSAIGGLFDPTKEAQVKELEARTAAQEAQAGILEQQGANMRAPLPQAVAGAKRAPVYGVDPVTGQPNPYPRYIRQAGLLNTVTGRVL